MTYNAATLKAAVQRRTQELNKQLDDWFTKIVEPRWLKGTRCFTIPTNMLESDIKPMLKERGFDASFTFDNNTTYVTLAITETAISGLTYAEGVRKHV